MEILNNIFIYLVYIIAIFFCFCFIPGIVILTFYFISKVIIKKTKKDMNLKGYKFTVEEKEKEIIKKVKQTDPNFNIKHFKKNMSNCISKIFESYNNCDLETLMMLESIYMLDIHKHEIELGRKKKQLKCTFPIDVKLLRLTKYSIDGTKEVLGCESYIMSKTILMDPNTKKVNKVADDYDTDFMYLEFIRTNGVKTKRVKSNSLNRCPNCGTAIELNEQGQCIYCDSTLINGEHDWVLNKIEPFVEFM